jgi:hypothetical protein
MITYIYRPLVNKTALNIWAMLNDLDPVEDPHVTIAYSRTPISMELPDLQLNNVIVLPNGNRHFQRMGKTGAGALTFHNDKLTQRHKELRLLGASWDYPQYIPHLTVTKLRKGQRITRIPIYTGDLIFGPERLEQFEA